MNDATQKLVTDVKTVAADMRELITATAEQSAEGIASGREKARATLANVQAGISAAQRAAVQKACGTARAADDYVHDSPWPFIGAAVLVGAAIGFVLGRR